MDNNFLYTQADDYATGKLTQKVPDLTGSDVLSYFTFETEWWDFVTNQSTANGQNITCLVINPTTDDKRSLVTQIVPVNVNAHLSAIEASMNQRPRHQYAVMEMSSDETVPVYTDYWITTLQQATTTLTLTMSSSVLAEWTIGDWINIAGCADNRLNYPNFCIATISANGIVVTGTVSDEATIPSLTVWPIATAGMTARKRRQLLGKDWYGMRFSGTSSTACAYLSKFGANITKVTGTLVGTQTVANASSVPTFTSGATGQVDIKATSKYFVRCDADSIFFYDRPIDSTNMSGARNLFTGVKPAWQKQLYARYSAISPKSMTRPVAKIISISKAGSTTWTVTHDGSYTFLTGQYVTIKWNRDQTNFASFATPVAITVVNPTTFTLIGTTGTATGYGGSVILANGQVDQPWIIWQTVQSITVDATNWFVTLVGSASWSGLNISEYIYLHGCRNNTNGGDMWYDWAWEVVTISTTTLVVSPVINYLWVNISPTLSTLGTTNCSGTVILMTTLRSHDSVFSEYTPSITQIDGQWTQDLTKAIPTYNTNNISSLTTVSSVTSSYLGIPLTVADQASWAITTTTTSATITPSSWTGYNVNIPVTAVTGTIPTMDVIIQESGDSGTNWFDVYQFDRITGTGYYQSPNIRMKWNRVRYVQTISGTTPSFTRSINRLQTNDNAGLYRQIMDRTISLTTLNAVTSSLYVEWCNNVTLNITLGTATTPPTIQLEWSDSGISTEFYSLWTALAGVASSTVSTNINWVYPKFIRARVSVAGVTIGTGYKIVIKWIW